MKDIHRSSFGACADVMRHRRRAERSSVLLPASVVTMSAYQYLDLINISKTGAKLRGERLPNHLATALFRIGSVTVLCRVVWVANDQCGVHFEEPLSAQMLSRISKEGNVAGLCLTPEEERIEADWNTGKAR